MQKDKINKVLTILLPVQIGIVFFLSNYPTFIERFYTNGVYPVISRFLRLIFGFIPFSIGDLIYTLLILLIVKNIILIFKRKFKNIRHPLLEIGTTLSIFYFCFYFFWGLNYSRLPIIYSMGLENQEAVSPTTSIEKQKGKDNIISLETLTNKLSDRLVSIQMELVAHDSIAVHVPYSKTEILNLTAVGYKNLSKTFPQFAYEPSSIKKSLYSLPLTYIGFAGYFNPLTGEAQVDYLIPKSSLPMTCSHEVAHQLGIASESEANFIGFLAGSFHNDKYFQYSAYLSALRYALFDIYSYDPELYKIYIKKIPLGIKKNIRENQEFWKRYENPAEPFFKIFYDNYLKVNQQKSGLRSYNQMVGLLIAYDMKYEL